MQCDFDADLHLHATPSCPRAARQEMDYKHITFSIECSSFFLPLGISNWQFKISILFTVLFHQVHVRGCLSDSSIFSFVSYLLLCGATAIIDFLFLLLRVERQREVCGAVHQLGGVPDMMLDIRT